MEPQETQQLKQKSRRRPALIVVVVMAALIGGVVYYFERIWVPNVPGIPQLWASSGVEYANTDSLAALIDVNGQVLVFATAKWGHRLDLFHGANGHYAESIGAEGEGLGEFRRPNGVLVVRFESANSDDESKRSSQTQSVIAVVERDGARVQFLSGDGSSSLGVLGTDILGRPYGAAVSYRERLPLLYVTDTGVAPDKTVSVFQLERTPNGINGKLVTQFGDAGEGRIYKAESIVVDDELNRVLLCDEDRSQHNVKVYDLDGRYAGRTFGDGIIGGDPEGIVIVKSATGDFILVTDQRSRITIWHAFDRESLEHITSFTGEPRIANTDGICILESAFGSHGAGALFAVNDDADVRAYDLGVIIHFVDQARSN